MRKLLRFALGIYRGVVAIFRGAVAIWVFVGPCFGSLILVLGDDRWPWWIFVCGLVLFSGQFIFGALILRSCRHGEIKPPKPLEELLAGELRAPPNHRQDQAFGRGLGPQVMTEALRLARGYVKDAIKRKGGKIHHYEVSQITAMAKKFLESPESGPAIVEKAKANLDRMGLQARRG
jgi:hypothetical protein